MECLWISFGHISVKIPLLQQTRMNPVGGTQSLVWSSAAEVSLVQSNVRPPFLCRSDILEICKSYLQ